jgi:hypothetical protein
MVINGINRLLFIVLCNFRHFRPYVDSAGLERSSDDPEAVSHDGKDCTPVRY